MTSCLSDLLDQSAARHGHLCPRQVLGVRIGLAGLRTLGLASPISRQTGLIIVETDGCFADGIEVASGATVGHRTLRVNDLGKIAATFADAHSGRAIRVSPVLDARVRAASYALREDRHYLAQLEAYARMSEEDLLHFEEIILNPPLESLISLPGVRVNCECCGEEIINQRQMALDGMCLCRTCANQGYYLQTASDLSMRERVESQAN